jgi:excinuclease UvrABC nuclease subunit
MVEWSSIYEYTETNVLKLTPKAGGVYRLCYKKDEKYYVFYVGQSDSLERRLLEHFSSSESNLCIKRYLKEKTCYMQWVTISVQADRDKSEEEEIEKYKPTCNDQLK